tara:strand:+ start:7568 stop:8980 length:1413 start_codon:yes stop_codon:yes gene_type:complete
MTNTKRILLTLSIIITSSLTAQNSYQLDFNVSGLSDGDIYLANYYGSGQYYKDTAEVQNGKFSFTGDTPLKEGMYSIVKDNGRLFDLFVDGQQFSMSTDTSGLIKNMVITNSPENTLFYDYMNYLSVQQIAMKELNAKKATAEKKKEIESIEKSIEELDKTVTNYRKSFFKKNSDSFTAKFLQSMEFPEIPDSPKLKDGSVDSLFPYRYTKAHLFDHIDFNDERFLNSPAYHEKMVYYISKLTPQIPDSINAAADYLLGKATNPEIFRYTVSYITSTYEKSEFIGMDAVFVHMARNYYLNGKADWISKAQLKKVKERADALEPLLIGKKAPNIIVKDTAQKNYIQLYDIQAKYLVVYIWSPECGHCKKSTPVLKKMYDKYKKEGLKVFAVGNDFENEKWIDFIKKNKLDFINGSDGGEFTSNFRHLYDVYSTPQTYLLDKDKKILVKKIEIEELDKYLEQLIKEDKAKNE